MRGSLARIAVLSLTAACVDVVVPPDKSRSGPAHGAAFASSAPACTYADDPINRVRTIVSGICDNQSISLPLGWTLVSSGAVSATAAPIVSSGSLTPINDPDVAYVSSTTLLDISSIPFLSMVTQVSDQKQTVSFSSPMRKLGVPVGWQTWSPPPFSETSTPDVLFTGGATSVTWTLGKAARTFGFEAEPNPFQLHTITADFYSGQLLIGSVSRAIHGFAGARLIAASSTGAPIDRIHISSTADFAVAQIRYRQGCRVNVTGYGQAQAPWGSATYDHIASTMQQKGCAVTSLTMGLTGRGIATDPGVLNALLKAGSGYTNGGSVIWAAAAQAGGGSYRPVGSDQAMESALCNGEAVVVGVNLDPRGTPGHFVLVTAKEGPSFTIQDPADGQEKTLAAYNNSYVFRGAIAGGIAPNSSVVGSVYLSSESTRSHAIGAQTSSTLSLSVDNAALTASDTQGNKVGIDPTTGAVQSSIPGSTAWADRIDDDVTGARGTVTTAFALVPNAAGTYTVSIVPTSAGTPTLIVHLLDGTPSSLVPSKVPLLAIAGQPIALTLSMKNQQAPTIVRGGGFAGARQDITAALQLGLIRGSATSLRQKLAAAEDAYRRGNRNASLNILGAFENEVRAQTNKGIDALVAQILLADAAALRTLVT